MEPFRSLFFLKGWKAVWHTALPFLYAGCLTISIPASPSTIRQLTSTEKPCFEKNNKRQLTTYKRWATKPCYVSLGPCLNLESSSVFFPESGTSCHLPSLPENKAAPFQEGSTSSHHPNPILSNPHYSPQAKKVIPAGEQTVGALILKQSWHFYFRFCLVPSDLTLEPLPPSSI